jgi:Ca2+-binding RTX toxin-like protein
MSERLIAGTDGGLRIEETREFGVGLSTQIAGYETDGDKASGTLNLYGPVAVKVEVTKLTGEWSVQLGIGYERKVIAGDKEVGRVGAFAGVGVADDGFVAEAKVGARTGIPDGLKIAGTPVPPMGGIGELGVKATIPYETARPYVQIPAGTAAEEVARARATDNPLSAYRDYPIEFMNGTRSLPATPGAKSPRPPSSIGTEAGTKGKSGSSPSGADPALKGGQGGKGLDSNKSGNDGGLYDGKFGTGYQGSGNEQKKPGFNAKEAQAKEKSGFVQTNTKDKPDYGPYSGPPSKPDKTPSSKKPDTSKFDNTKAGGGKDGPGGAFAPSTGVKSKTESKSKTKPVILDLDNDGIEITELSRSTVFMDADGDGLVQRTAWAGAGDGVLFYDAGNDGLITEKREYVFTEWDPTATSDLKALKAAFDTNGDGKLTAADAAFLLFKVMVTNADGTQTAKTLAELGITEINLNAAVALVTLPDGSQITGTSTFTMNGQTRTLVDTILMAEAMGYRIEKSATVNGTYTIKAYDASGNLAYSITNTTSANGLNIENRYDDNGDGVVDRIQTIDTTINATTLARTETVINKLGNAAATAIIQNKTVTTTSADGKQVTIQRDSSGGGWFDQVETRTKNPDNSHTNITSNYAKDGTTLLSKSTETINVGGNNRIEDIDADGLGGALGYETRITESITDVAGVRTTTIITTNRDGTLRTLEKEVIAANGRDKVISRDRDGNGTFETVENLTVTLNPDTTRTNVLDVRNADGTKRTITSYTQSADTLSKTINQDMDDDAAFERKTTDVTVIAADQSRIHDVVVRSADNTLISKMRETLGADKVSSESWIDLNRDGIFQGTDLIESVTVNAGTGERTETNFSRNVNGSFNAKQVTVTSSNGLTVNRTVDADGDGDTDSALSDVTTVLGGGASQQDVQIRNGDASLRNYSRTITSADGLTTTTYQSVDGDSDWDAVNVTTRLLNGDQSVTTTTTNYAGDATTLLSRSVTTQSADRLTNTTSTDVNGDGVNDLVVNSVEAVNGQKTITTQTFKPNGVLASKTISTVSANGLIATATSDADGNGINETIRGSTTVLNVDGSKTNTQLVKNGDNTLRTMTTTTVSDDGLTTNTYVDANGDGVNERRMLDTTTLLANGSTTRQVDVLSSNNTLLGWDYKSVSDDGLTIVRSIGIDGDGQGDWQENTVTTLNDDGSTTSQSLVYDVDTGSYGYALRVKTQSTVSADGRTTNILRDVNGDLVTDEFITRAVQDNGSVVTTVLQKNADGTLQSKAETTVSGNGLVATSKIDRNGDGVYDTITADTAVLNTNGSQTITQQQTGSSGTVIRQDVTTTSADGLVTTKTSDFENNGVIDRTTVSTTTINLNGSVVTAMNTKSSNNTTIYSATQTVSGDKKTVTQSVDADGNGQADWTTVSQLGVNGDTTKTTTYFSKTGTADGTEKTVTSFDGLLRLTERDFNGDGRAEIKTQWRAELGDDGTRLEILTIKDKNNVIIGKEETFISDDGLFTNRKLDLDGDGKIDYRNSLNTVFNADGSTTVTAQSFDGVDVLKASATTTLSGTGLLVTKSIDFNGNGGADRTDVLVTKADGASTQTLSSYNLNQQLAEKKIITVSADSRTINSTLDLNGDGFVDRTSNTQIDLSRNTKTILTDLAKTGAAEAKVTLETSANGLVEKQSFDLDGNGTNEVIRQAVTGFGTDGSTIETVTETYGSTLVSRSVETKAASGLSSTTTFDIDGNGTIDETNVWTKTFAADGSVSETSKTTLADGTVREHFGTTTSVDGRTSTTTYDKDGNGVSERVYRVEVGLEGDRTEFDTTYTTAGVQQKQTVTKTSADGLTTTISRGDVLETITRSSLENGSYSWDNGVAKGVGTTNVKSVHTVDAVGVETWTFTAATTVQSVNPNYTGGSSSSGTISYGQPQYIYTDVIETKTIAFDQTAKAQLFSAAARIFDTVLDRGMAFSEQESLVSWLKDGVLDNAKLAGDLASSSEFTTRYGTTSDGEFVQQLYMNSFGRAPSLAELDNALRMLTTPTNFGYASTAAARAGLAIELAESSEHLTVGNDHMSTNNGDLDLSPPQFERILDRPTAQAWADRLIDVLYDRDATVSERQLITSKILTGTQALDDIVAEFRAATGDSSWGVGTLTGGELVNRAFLNALGRLPTPTELDRWSGNLSAGRLTVDQFIVALALSTDHLAVGNGHVASSNTSTVVDGTAAADTLSAAAGVATTLYGFAGNDSLTGNSKADILIGGLGTDTLAGSSGSDQYVWTKGDGADLIADGSASLAEQDRLVLTNVASNDVELTRVNGSNDLKIRIVSTNETITVQSHFYYATTSYGIESITFSDGISWSTSDIWDKTTVSGTSVAETVGGTQLRDNILGLAGNDSLVGYGGDDKLTGGLGTDTLNGGAGNDSYIWTKLDGADTIADDSASLQEQDRLVLTNVTSTDVELTRVNGSNDLKIRIISTNETITVQSQYYAATTGYGVETINFSDGVTWTLNDILDKTIISGTAAAESVSGSRLRDNIFGLAGNDSLVGYGGDDELTGGLGTDTLNGGAGNDSYIWTKLDGADTIADDSASMVEQDRLVLTNVTSTEVELTRVNGSNDLKIRVISTNETITVQSHYYYATTSYGIESISFSDGVIWSLSDILDKTTVSGTSAAETVSGSQLHDNILGLAGNDTLYGYSGNDKLIGGTGNDYLDGGEGSELYLWSKLDGSDTVYDTGASLREVDTLSLSDVRLERLPRRSPLPIGFTRPRLAMVSNSSSSQTA